VPELYAEVILPLAVRSNFTYALRPEHAALAAPGQRVLVSFGKSKIYTGIIRALSELPPPGANAHKIKHIEDLLDPEPVLFPAQLALYDWIAAYYACTPGEVVKAALPAALKPESALRVEMRDLPHWRDLPLDEKEYALLEALSIQPVLSLADVAQIWDITHLTPRLRNLEARGLIRLFQQVEERYKPLYKTYLRLAPAYAEDRDRLEGVFESLAKAPRQENLLMRVVSDFFQGKMAPKTEALKAAGADHAALKALISKGIVEEEQVQMDRLELAGYSTWQGGLALTPLQASALGQLRAAARERPPRPALLHGITGSGKTLLYTEMIREALQAGKQALYLLPEITLTKQIIDRVMGELGEGIGIYHSRFSQAERVEIWHKVRSGEYRAVVGVRSAIFLPFRDLGLIVVDEEHDPSFKQQDPAPRYNARDVAVYYGAQQGIPVLLGSATPSFETYLNAQTGKYRYVSLPQRAVAGNLPEISLVDLRKARKQGKLEGMFSETLLQAIGEALERQEQVILFQNRRGYAPYLICESCGHVPECVNCDISLTYHKDRNHLRCHYCGYIEQEPQKCPQCGQFTLQRAGIGTEKIEEAVAAAFPNHRVERLDLDTTRTKNGFREILDRFERRQTDILVGTQMVSKGLDFENVTLVGVVQADPLLTFPDFRAYERAYQLLTQVSGRAGRSQKAGRVVIQTMMPDNLVLQSLQKPFEPFFQQEAAGRRQIGYPPFTRLIRIELSHPDRAFVERESKVLQGLLGPRFGAGLLGPDFALVARLRNRYRMQFLLKLAKNVSPAAVRDALQQIFDRYYSEAAEKTLRIAVDADPV
jgi:primosomal protein N' (replication factor Y)